MRVDFHIPFDNQRHFHSVLPSDFDQHRLFKGEYAEQVWRFFINRYAAREVVLTASCTSALELAALLLDLQPHDEVIVPSYTYVSTANAFELFGARLVLCDSAAHSPNMDPDQLETLITPNTKAIVVVHYGGIAPDMHRLRAIAQRHGIILIEDAAHAIESYYDHALLGSFGDFSVFSFHETKNVTCGQGGVLLINNPEYVERARVLRDCGTDRHRFALGLTDRYTWQDIGSVYNLSELNCAYLAPQLEHIEMITQKRIRLWKTYYRSLLPLQEKAWLQLPFVSERSRHNAHIFYIVVASQAERDALIAWMKEQDIAAAFHYSPLHLSPYYLKNHAAVSLPMAERFAACLLRLPLYYDLEPAQQNRVIQRLCGFFDS